MKFRFIATEKAHHSLSLLCRCLRVTRSGFYAWRKRSESAHARRDRQLKLLVRASFDASKQRYGSPRIHRDLIEQQQPVSRKRVIRLMQEEGLKARVRKRFKCTTMSDHNRPVAAIASIANSRLPRRINGGCRCGGSASASTRN